MKNDFPGIEDYVLTIKNMGGKAFKTLSHLHFVSDSAFKFEPEDISIFFKATCQEETYAIGVFLTTDQREVSKYEAVSKYLEAVQVDWKINTKFLNDEIEVNGKWYPVLKMDWVKGLPIDRFISQNLNSPGINEVFSELQQQLVSLYNSTETHNIIHGSIQYNNVIVQSSGSGVKIKLMGYTGLKIPNYSFSPSDEKILSDFKYPESNPVNVSHFNDRFSVWVMLAALEALKVVDKTLWKDIENTGSDMFCNVFFGKEDYINFEELELVKRLYGLNRLSLDYYLDNLSESYKKKSKEIKKPDLYVGKDESSKDKVLESCTISNDSDSRGEIGSSDEFREQNEAIKITLKGKVLDHVSLEKEVKKTAQLKGWHKIFLFIVVICTSFLLWFKFLPNKKSIDRGPEFPPVIVDTPLIDTTLPPVGDPNIDETLPTVQEPIDEKVVIKVPKVSTPKINPSKTENNSKEPKPTLKPPKSGLEEYQNSNYTTAHKLFTKEANQGNTEAQFYLGRMYERGEGVDKDKSQALFWYEKAAKGGDSRAKYRIDALLKLQSLD